MVWYPWHTPRGLLEMRPEPYEDLLCGTVRSDIGETALLTPAGATGFSFTQFFDLPGGAINGVSCRIGAQTDQFGGPLIDSIMTATFDDGYSYSFPESSNCRVRLVPVKRPFK